MTQASHAPATASVSKPTSVYPIDTEVFTPTDTFTPMLSATPSAVSVEPPSWITGTLVITVVYDNISHDQRLTTAWGYSALVEYHDHTLLFDTGGDGQILMENMHALGIDPMSIDRVVLSHAHDDHTGGVTALLNSGATPVVYLLPSFPVYLKQQIERFTQISEVSPGQSLAEGIWTTGEIPGSIPEQALVIQTAQGLVVITGCAHPGIIVILEQVRTLFPEPFLLVMGGFHLVEKSDLEINAILEEFRLFEVKQVAPSHCTGEYAISRFRDEYNQSFIQAGVGSVIRYETILSR